MLSSSINGKQLNIGRNSPLGAVFPDFIPIGFQPVIPANVTLFSDKSCFAYEIPSVTIEHSCLDGDTHLSVHF